MGCNSCKNLKINEKKEGSCGACYYCTKVKKYVLGTDVCDNYSCYYEKTNYLKK